MEMRRTEFSALGVVLVVFGGLYIPQLAYASGDCDSNAELVLTRRHVEHTGEIICDYECHGIGDINIAVVINSSAGDGGIDVFRFERWFAKKSQGPYCLRISFTQYENKLFVIATISVPNEVETVGGVPLARIRCLNFFLEPQVRSRAQVDCPTKKEAVLTMGQRQRVFRVSDLLHDKWLNVEVAIFGANDKLPGPAKPAHTNTSPADP